MTNNFYIARSVLILYLIYNMCLLVHVNAENISPYELRPKEVTVGVHVNQILEVNFTEDFFILDFWLWFRWTPSTPNEFDISNYSPVKNFEIIDGQILHKIGEERDDKGEFTYENVRVIAKIAMRFDMKAYPVDSHKLTIQIEDQNHRVEKLIYVPDIIGTAVSESVGIPGWTIRFSPPVVAVNSYKTNFGNIELPPGFISKYTQFQYTLELQKPIILSIIKTLWPTFIATAVAILALFLSPSYEPRFGLAIGALFAIVANKLSITSTVQDSVQLGFTDIVQLVSGMIILLVLIESVVAYRINRSRSDSEDLIKGLDVRTSLILVGFYFILVVFLVLAFK